MQSLKRIGTLALSACIAFNMGLSSMQISAFAADPETVTADNVQNNRCYINGDEIRAYDADSSKYIIVDDLSAYGFDVKTSGKTVTIDWAGTDYYFDFSFSPDTDHSGLKKGSVMSSSFHAKIGGKTVPLYSVSGDICVKAEDLDAFGYHIYDSEKNILNVYVTEAGYTQNEKGYRDISIDVDDVSGSIRSLQGYHRDPDVVGSVKYEAYKEMGIDSIRTHDAVGDIGEIYVPMHAEGTGNSEKITQKAATEWNPDDYDATDWKNYDFSSTDKMIDDILASGGEVFFRFGNGHYNDTVPEDPAEWDKYLNEYVEVAKKIVRYYNFGENNNGKYKDTLSYFEFWNEPDLTTFWDGTPEQFYEFYEKVVRAVREIDPSLPVGGPALTTLNDYVCDASGVTAKTGGYEESFIKYVAEKNVPMDFYSFHYYPSYNSDPYEYSRIASRLTGLLEEYGLKNIPLTLTEWDVKHQGRMAGEAEAAYVASAMIYMQDTNINKAYIYYPYLIEGDGYGQQLSDSYTLTKRGYGYKAVGQMNATNQRLAVTGADKNGFAVLAGKNAASDQINVLISNYQVPAAEMLTNDGANGGLIKGNDFELWEPNPFVHEGNYVATWTVPTGRVMTYQNANGYNLTVNNIPYNTQNVVVEQYRVDQDNDLKLISSEKIPVNADGTLTLAKALGNYSVDLLTIKPGDAKPVVTPVTPGGQTQNPNPSTPDTKPAVTPPASGTKAPAVGTKVTQDGKIYKVTSAAEVAYVGVSNKNTTSVTVPAKVTISGKTYKVTSIDKNAFKGNKKVKTVTIKSGIVTIGASAFQGCTALKKVTIPATVKKIGAKAFYNCKKLTSVTIKTKKLTGKNVGKNAFKKAGSNNYKKLKVKVPSSKLKAYKKLLKKKGLSSKVKVIK